MRRRSRAYQQKPKNPLMSGSIKAENDLFEQVAVRKALRQLGANHSGWFMVKDRNHKFQIVNQRFAETIGKSAEEIIGVEDVDLGFPPPLLFGDAELGLPGVRVLDEQCMASGEPMRTVDGTVDLGGGRFDSTLTVRTPLTNNAGEVVGLIMQVMDHSDVRRLETQIESANETASDLDGKLSTLDRLICEILICHDRHVLLQKIADTIVSQTYSDGAYMAILQDNMCLEMIAGSGLNGQALIGKKFRQGEGLIGRAWESGEMIFTDDATASGAVHSFKEKTQVCAIPIRDGDKVVAVLCAVLPMGKELSLKDDIPTLRRIVDLAGIALSNARLIETTNYALQQTRTLAEVSGSLATVDSIEEACKVVNDSLCGELKFCESGIVLMDAQRRIVGITSNSMDPSSELDESEHVQLLKHLAQRCVETGQQVTLSFAPDSVENNTTGIHFYPSNHAGGAFALPVLRHGKITGALCVVRLEDTRPLDGATHHILTTLTSQLGTTLERHELSSALHHQAFHDRLTGLPNRHQFETELDRLLAKDETGAVLYIDLDGFKNINDTMGHGAGDQLLRLVANRLERRLKSNDVLARMGGDEFAIILRSVSETEDALACGERVLEALSTCFLIEKARIKISASVGLSRFPEDGDSVDTLLRNADVAMYQAKHSGKARLLSFDVGIGQELRERAKLQSDLQQALEQNQFELHYQPQVCCATEQVLGVEALLRWTHPERGNVSPGEFIPAAEHAGLINEIGTWVLERAVRQIAEWRSTPMADKRVSINIAATQFQQENFTELVLSSLERYDAPSDRLELEVTESVVMTDVAAVARRLELLRDAGIRIAIDDFGTGYSSLSYLQDLPLDVLKIDRAFVTRLQDEQAEKSVANTIALLATGLGLETVAEGVETEEQRDAIIGMGCEMIQGFFYSRPVPASELTNTVQRLQGEALKWRAA